MSDDPNPAEKHAIDHALKELEQIHLNLHTNGKMGLWLVESLCLGLVFPCKLGIESPKSVAVRKLVYQLADAIGSMQPILAPLVAGYLKNAGIPVPGTGAVLEMWVVYDHPKDAPALYVVRKHSIVPGIKEPVPSMFYQGSNEIETVRNQLRSRGLMRLDRNESDEPHIMETWI